MIAQNLAQVKQRIEDSAKRAGRNPQEITLVCVTKSISLLEIREVLALGVTDIGENRVNDALSKFNYLSRLSNDVRWHMIGHLQTNKVRKFLRVFNIIHSLDSLKLAVELDKQAKAINKRISCFVEVNLSGEEAKYGIRPDDASNFIKEVSLLLNLHVIGLMTMAPFAETSEAARPYFRDLSILRDHLLKENIPNTDVRELSMGMTQDFETAIEEGATFVRIGTALFLTKS